MGTKDDIISSTDPVNRGSAVPIRSSGSTLQRKHVFSTKNEVLPTKSTETVDTTNKFNNNESTKSYLPTSTFRQEYNNIKIELSKNLDPTMSSFDNQLTTENLHTTNGTDTVTGLKDQSTYFEHTESTNAMTDATVFTDLPKDFTDLLPTNMVSTIQTETILSFTDDYTDADDRTTLSITDMAQPMPDSTYGSTIDTDEATTFTQISPDFAIQSTGNFETTETKTDQTVFTENVATTEILSFTDDRFPTKYPTHTMTVSDGTIDSVTYTVGTSFIDSTDESLIRTTGDAFTDETVETFTDVTEEPFTDVTEGTFTDVTEEIFTDVTEEPFTDVKEETFTDVTEETFTDATEETFTDVTEETFTDVTEETFTDVTEETFTDVTVETFTDITEETLTESTTDIFIDTTEKSFTDTTGDAATTEATFTDIIVDFSTDTTEESFTDITGKPVFETTEKLFTDKTHITDIYTEETEMFSTGEVTTTDHITITFEPSTIAYETIDHNTDQTETSSSFGTTEISASTESEIEEITSKLITTIEPEEITTVQVLMTTESEILISSSTKKTTTITNLLTTTTTVYKTTTAMVTTTSDATSTTTISTSTTSGF